MTTCVPGPLQTGVASCVPLSLQGLKEGTGQLGPLLHVGPAASFSLGPELRRERGKCHLLSKCVSSTCVSRPHSQCLTNLTHVNLIPALRGVHCCSPISLVRTQRQLTAGGVGARVWAQVPVAQGPVPHHQRPRVARVPALHNTYSVQSSATCTGLVPYSYFKTTQWPGGSR